MSYLTKQQFIHRFGQVELDDLVRSLEVEDADARIEACIADAEAMVNGYLAGRYTVPVVANAMTARLAGDIARYFLWDDAASVEVRQRYDDAIKLLKDISGGKVELASASDEAAAVTSSTDRMLVEAPASRLGLEGY